MLTLADPLDHARRTAGDRTALVCGNVRVDYAALHDRCARLVGALFGLGVQAGDRVAVLSLNCHRMVETFFAVPAGGLVVVPLNTRLATAEVGAILADARATVLLTDRDPGPLAAHAPRRPLRRWVVRRVRGAPRRRRPGSARCRGRRAGG